jgi:formate hydrogenlyase subunit 6/NADH:ubiquinone oxidoreductase subunit I
MLDERKLNAARKRTYGIGLLKGMAVTLKHLFKHNTVIEYPDEKQDLGPRTRGVIALKEENCTVCMLCARECPDWCIYIDSHKETLPPKREGGRPRKRNVLDRFAIDYALCMYCGICVEVCPYDALFWSREFEYAEYDIRQLTHEKERLSDWMATVLPPPALEVGAEQPGQPAPAAVAAAPAPTAAAPAAGATTPTAAPSMSAPAETAEADKARLPEPPSQNAGAAAVGSPQRDVPPAQAAAAQEEPEQAAAVPPPSDSATRSGAEATQGDVQAGETSEQQPADVSTTEAHSGPDSSQAAALSEQEKAAYQEEPGPNVDVPAEQPQPVALERSEDAEAVYQQVLQEQLDKGSSAQVAEARARVARAKAERGIKRGPTPMTVDKPVPSAPTKGAPPPEPSGAPEAKAPEPDPGPVAATPTEAGAAGSDVPEEPTTAPTEEAPAAEPAPAPEAQASEPQPATPADGGSDETPDQVFERVLQEEKAKGSSDAVAQGRAKAARVKAERAQK